MKYRFAMVGLLAWVAVAGSAQMMTSHAPTSPNTTNAFPAPQPVTEKPPEVATMQVTGKPVVQVNGATLTDRDLLREMYALFPYAKLHNGFPKKQESGIRKGAMQMIVFEELVYQDAVRRKVTIAPERIAREERKFQQQFGSQEEFKSYLQTEMGGSDAKLKQQIKRSLLIEALLKIEVDNKSAVTLSDARAYYDKNPKEFEHGETFTFQTISILPPANASPQTLEETRQRAEGILKQAKATKNYGQFGLLAEKVSEDDFRVDMGDHKLVKGENLPTEVVAAARAMKVGDVGDLLKLGTAYTIIRLNAHTLTGKTKFAEVKADLLTRLHKQKFENLRSSLGKKLRENAKIQEL